MKALSLIIFTVFINVAVYGQTIYMSEPYKYTERPGGAGGHSLTSLSSDKVVVGYSDAAVWDQKLRIGHVKNGKIIEYGPEFTVDNELGAHRIAVTKLSDSKFIVTYNNRGGTKIRVCEVWGRDFIARGQPVPFKHGFESQIAISDSLFLITSIIDSYGYCTLGKINEKSEVTFGAPVKYTDKSIYNLSYVSLDTLSSTKFVIAYGYWDGKAVVGSVTSNGDITFGDTYVYNSKPSISINVVGLSANHFGIVHAADGYEDLKGALELGNLDESENVTFSERSIFNDLKTGNIAATKLSPSEVVISFDNRGDDNFGYLTIANISDHAVSFSEKVLHNPQFGGGSSPLSTLGENKFLVQYSVYGNTPLTGGYIKLCSTEELLLSSSIANEVTDPYLLYPNPSNGFLNIISDDKIEATILKLYDLNGQIFFVNKFTSNKFNLDLTNYHKGIYMLQLITGKNIITKKVVIK